MFKLLSTIVSWIPLENLWGVRGGRSTKKYFRKRKLNEKTNSCTLTNPKKCSFYGLKKNSYKEFDNEKNSCATTIPNQLRVSVLMFLAPTLVNVYQATRATEKADVKVHISKI